MGETGEFRAYPSLPVYLVSDRGEVMKDGLSIKPTLMKIGYFSVRLSVYPIRRRVYVHHMVLETFVSPRPDGMITRHLDGNRLNNRLSNLRWGTNQENSDDRTRHGRATRGESISSSKLKESDIPIIRELAARGVPKAHIARIFGVSHQPITGILYGRWWKHV